MAETKVTKIDEQGEQTTFFYENELGKVENLVNCVMQYHFHNMNWWSGLYKKKAAEIRQQVKKGKLLYIWCCPTANIGYCTRI